jgi:hypothetical protein
MKYRWISALAVLGASASAFAQAPPTARPGVLGHADGFAAPNGPLGAGLSISRVEGFRAYGELAFFTQSSSDEETFPVPGGPDQTFSVSAYVTTLSAVVGGGYKIAPDLEVEVELPLAMDFNGFELDAPGTAFDEDEDNIGAAVGNLHVGVNYVRSEEPIRLKIGGAIAYGPWTIDPGEQFGSALAVAQIVRQYQDRDLWETETVSLVTPSRIEFGEQFVGTADGFFGLYIPTNGGETDFAIHVAPGFGVYANEQLLLGARLPFIWTVTDSSSIGTLLAFEPYIRYDLEQAFLNTRFTLNLDEPLGFSFDEGKIWAWYAGGGATF